MHKQESLFQNNFYPDKSILESVLFRLLRKNSDDTHENTNFDVTYLFHFVISYALCHPKMKIIANSTMEQTFYPFMAV